MRASPQPLQLFSPDSWAAFGPELAGRLCSPAQRCWKDSRVLPPADPPASLPRVRQHRRHPQDGTESKLIYKKKKGKEKIYRKLSNRKKVPRRRGGETGARGTKGLAGGTGKRRALDHCCLHVGGEEGTAGARGSAIWGAELSTSCHRGSARPQVRPPYPAATPNPSEFPTTSHVGHGGREEATGGPTTSLCRKEVLKCFFDNPTF